MNATVKSYQIPINKCMNTKFYTLDMNMQFHNHILTNNLKTTIKIIQILQY